MKENCRECGVAITNRKNVGEERTRYGSLIRTDYLCMPCHLRKGDRLVKRTRTELGWDTPPSG